MTTARDLILYVDDEEQALKYFRMAFTKDYEVMTAASAEEGLALIRQQSDRLALVISDQRMPGMTGAELLAVARELAPRAMRVLTTAYSDLDAAVAAVNQGWVYAYVHKPWRLDELRLLIIRVLGVHHLLRERDELLAEKLATVQDLLLVDRLRGLALTAGGAAAGGARPFAAALSWWRERIRLGAPAPLAGRDGWLSALSSTRELAGLGRTVGQWTNAHRRGPVVAGDLATTAALVAAEAGATCTAGGAPLPLTADHGYLAAGLGALCACLRTAAGLSGDAVHVAVTCEAVRALTITVSRSGSTAPTSALDLDCQGMQAWLALFDQGAVISGTWAQHTGTWRVAFPEVTTSDTGLEVLIDALASQER